jgi:hypothetical protein
MLLVGIENGDVVSVSKVCEDAAAAVGFCAVR